jgi:hypothetical protein
VTLRILRRAGWNAKTRRGRWTAHVQVRVDRNLAHRAGERDGQLSGWVRAAKHQARNRRTTHGARMERVQNGAHLRGHAMKCQQTARLNDRNDGLACLHQFHPQEIPAHPARLRNERECASPERICSSPRNSSTAQAPRVASTAAPKPLASRPPAHHPRASDRPRIGEGPDHRDLAHRNVERQYSAIILQQYYALS